MKKTLVATILGLAAVASTFGQGYVAFNNYVASPYNQVKYSANPAELGPRAAMAGEAVGATFTVELFYALGTVADFGQLISTGTTVPISIQGGTGGWYIGPTVTIAGYSSGPITFGIRAWEGANYNDALFRGQSGLWTEASIATGLSTPSNFGPGYSGVSVVFVPEPSTFALAGLGSAALLIFRRRK